MKSIITLVLLLTSLSVGAQTSPTGITTNAALSAVSIVMNVGGWIFKDSKKVYYVQVESTGLTEEDARKAGFSKAVEVAVGAIVFTGREVQDNNLTRNEIVSHSGGYVEDFKIIKQQSINGMTKLTMDVWVSDAKIANRLNGYGQNTGNAVNGEQFKNNWEREKAIKVTSEKRERTGRELVQSVLVDLPKMGYVNKVTSTNVSRYSNGLSMGIVVETTFNREYIKDLAKIMKETSGDMSYWSGIPANERRVILDHKGLGSGWTRTNTYFNDYVNAFEQPLYMIIKFYDTNNKLNFTNCWNFVDKNDYGDRELAGYQADNDPRNRGMGFSNMNFYVIDEAGKLTMTYLQPRGTLSEEQFINWASKISRVEAELVDGNHPSSNLCSKK